MLILFLTPKDLQLLYGLKSYNGAWKKYNDIKTHLEKEKHQKLRIKDVAHYEGIEPADIERILSS